MRDTFIQVMAMPLASDENALHTELSIRFTATTTEYFSHCGSQISFQDCQSRPTGTGQIMYGECMCARGPRWYRRQANNAQEIDLVSNEADSSGGVGE